MQFIYGAKDGGRGKTIKGGEGMMLSDKGSAYIFLTKKIINLFL